MSDLNSPSDLDRLLMLFYGLKRDYKRHGDISELTKKALNIAELYGDYMCAGDILVTYGEELISGGDRCGGMTVIRIAYNEFKHIANQTVMLMRLAEAALDDGNVDDGKKYISELCKRVDNLEESISVNELTDIFKRYKSYFEEVLSEISEGQKKTPLSPSECTLSIADILKAPKERALGQLSEHLNELTADGKFPEILSRQEYCIFIADEFVEHVNSDGISHYLESCHEHFPLLPHVFKEFDVSEGVRLTEMIDKAIRKSGTAFIGLKKEEGFYYKKVEEKLLENMYSYFVKNKEAFK